MSSPFNKLLGISTALVFMLSISTLAVEGSTTSTMGADILFGDKIVYRQTQRFIPFDKTKVLGASIEIATVSQNYNLGQTPELIVENPIPLPTPIAPEWQINAYKPSSGENLPLGSNYLIHWNTSPNPDTDDHIGAYLALLKPGDPEFIPGAAGVLVGAGDLSYAGNYNWKIGQYADTTGTVNAPLGSGYKIAAVLYNFTTNAIISRNTTDEFSIVESLEGLPDLIVENIGINPSNAAAGDTYTVVATIKNIGDADAFIVGAYPPMMAGGNLIVSRDGQELFLSGGGSDVRAALPPDETTTFVFGGDNITDLYTFTHPSTYTYKVNVDINGNIIESNEENNSKTISYEVESQICAGPGLRADIYGGPNQICCNGLILEGGVCNVDRTIPSITVSSPNGGEKWAAGSVQTVAWESNAIPTDFDGIVQIDIYKENAAWLAQSEQVPGNPEKHEFKLRKDIVPSDEYKIRLTVCSKASTSGFKCFGSDYYSTDTSNDYFTITQSVQIQPSEKLTVCHYNKGFKKYNEIILSETSWKNEHKKHEYDFIKGSEAGSCLDIAIRKEIIDGATFVPLPKPVEPKPLPPVDDDGIIAQLKARIKQLEIKLTQFEKTVIERERKLIKKIDQVLTNRLKGRILLQVEGAGEAWYVDEDTGQRFYLRDGNTAYDALRAFGLGITNANLDKIPVGLEDEFVIKDSDKDGLPDKLEEAIGTDPNNPDSDGDGFKDGEEVKAGFSAKNKQAIKKAINQSLVNNLKGKILLQVEDKGQAWYLNPENGKRYYMKDGDEAYNMMRFLSLGITNKDLSGLDVGDFETLAQ